MKKTALIILSTFVAIATYAQRPERPHKNARNNLRKAVQDLPPEKVGKLAAKKMTLALELTAEQQAQIETLEIERATARKAKMEARKKTERPTAEQIYKIRAQAMERQIAHKRKMKQVLNAEQYERWEKMTLRRHTKMKQRHRGKKWK
ncbi:MAG: hypothetical protein ACPG7E_04435 [Marinirhabdus sp.]